MTEKTGVKFKEKNFGVSTFKFNRWSLELDEGESIDDVSNSAAWANLAPVVMGFDKTAPKGRGDIVEVRKMDSGLYAEFLIREIGPGFVRLTALREFEPETAEIAEGVPFITRWNVGKRSHEVLRKSDSAVMQGGFQSKDSAVAWIENHMKAVAA
jgi:hypothetical protein